MTDLQREAREAAKAAADSLGAMGAWETADGSRDRPGVRFNFIEAFKGGFIAAASLREKELSELRAKLETARKAIDAYVKDEEYLSSEIATLRARVAELELEVEITAREALDRIAELEGMVPKWVKSNDIEEFSRLEDLGWSDEPQYNKREGWTDILMVPPIPAPETKP